MAELKGSCIVAQSGGPTTVINSSLCGVAQEAKKHKCFDGIYASLNGILGVLREEIFDLRKEKPSTIEALRRTPAAAAGSCRYKLRSLEDNREDYERILDVFKAHNIRYFFYAGGNDSMDTADKLSQLAREAGYEMRAMGVPKTIDNDLACTDHCPGFGSVAKFIATMSMEAGRDTEALYTTDTCTVLETMGRNAGWIAAAGGCAQRTPVDAPHLVYVPEVAFDMKQFVKDVKKVLHKLGRCFITASEGIQDKDGNYIAEIGGGFAKDSFGHRQLGGVAETLREIIENKVGVKCRSNKLGTCQRNAMHFASKTDSDEAYRVGAQAVREAAKGTTGKMVTLVRKSNKPYRCTTGLADLSAVANGERKVPRSWMNKDGNHITRKMRDYITPLMRGEVPIRVDKDGLPVFMRFEKKFLPKKCQAW
ncbi:MAG: 6-phosphofructokinase [Planctomycetes bacterium]|nr:6-phosphofructokinase [Planctomycetota bacterium]